MSVEKLIDDVLLYLIWLQKPLGNFNDMPVCPFIKKDLDNDEILFLVQTSKDKFLDLVEEWDKSGKKTGLIIQMNMVQYGDKRKNYQIWLNRQVEKLWERGPEQPKVLVFDPTEQWKLAGVQTRKRAPTLLINLARRKDLNKAHSMLQKTRWYERLSTEDLKKLRMEPTSDKTTPSNNS